MKFVLKDCSVEVGTPAVDISGFCSAVTIETTFDDVDVTSFGAIYREILQGLGDATITLSIFQDFDAASVDETLWPLSQSGDPFAIVIRPRKADPVGPDNPEYTMTGVLLSYNPLDGSIGDASATEVTIRNASQAGLTRAVA